MRSPAHVPEERRRRLPLLLVRAHVLLVAVVLATLTGVIRDPDAPMRIEAVDPGIEEDEPDRAPSVVDEVPRSLPSLRSAPVPTTATTTAAVDRKPPPEDGPTDAEAPASTTPVEQAPKPKPAESAEASAVPNDTSPPADQGGDGGQPAGESQGATVVASSVPSAESSAGVATTAGVTTTAGGATSASSAAPGPSASATSATTAGSTSSAAGRSATTTTTRSTTTTRATTAATRATTTTTRPTTTTTGATTTTRPTTTTTVPTTTTTTTTTTTVADAGANAGLERLRNLDPRFVRYTDVPSVGLSLSALTEPAPVNDNGTVGDGQFRMACQYSHFGYDDPIVYPGQPGRAHLHMFFGNTETDAFSTTDSLVNGGGGTCNGFELNRSGYWTPALLDGKGNTVVPEQIILYYKTKQPDRVKRMPQGLKMIAGNTTSMSFTVSDYLAWSCGDSGRSYNRSNRIPDCGGDTFNAAIAFPQCWDGRNLDSADHRSHMATVSPHADCPSSHPVRLPQITILLYYEGVPSVDGWHLSSDHHGGMDAPPGGTLHADWWGGWNDEAMDLWIDGCMKAARNCSYGQTGTPRMLAKLNAFQNFPGDKFLPLP